MSDDTSSEPIDKGLAASLAKLERLGRSHGELAPGQGLASGVFALVLAGLSLLGIVGFHFPAYTSTPELRAHYDVQTLRYLMMGAMVLAGAISLSNVVFGRKRWLAATTFAILVVGLLLGGPNVPIGDFAEHTPYVGLDFFILDLLGSTVVFVVIEKLWPLRDDQPLFRAEWQNDLVHFFFNHLIVGFTLLVTSRVVHDVFGFLVSGAVQAKVAGLPFAIQLVLVILAADVVQYWLHRAYHEVPFLWRFHSVHHSARHMDWLAGSRQHILELLLTRILVLAPIFVLGFPQSVIDVYVIVVGFQAVFNHANVDVRLGPLRYLIVTPNFHHWHHSRDTEAIDKNYAAHFAFLDHLFGTAVSADRKWPSRYGVVGDYVPLGFVAQQSFPFVGSTVSRERPSLPTDDATWTKPSESNGG